MHDSRRYRIAAVLGLVGIGACATSGTLEDSSEPAADGGLDAARAASSFSGSSSSGSSSDASSSAGSSSSSSGGACALAEAAHPRMLLPAAGEERVLSIGAAEQQTRARPSANYSGDCPSSTLDETQYGVVLELSNSDDEPHDIDLWVTPLHGSENDRVLYVYNDAAPLDDDATKACNEANDACVVGGNIAGADACLQDLRIPPCTTRWLLVIDFGTRTQATDFEVHAKTLE